jgi:mannan endo-1,4-beta-mannosidase
VIKSIDPDAKVFGPASWGVTEFQTLQFAPDWPDYRQFGSFIAAYLAAFAKASEDAGIRLLDVLDVHWYPQSPDGYLIDAQDDKFAEIMLAAPRSLTERGYREDSWITDALPVSDATELALPILPSLSRLIERWYPGTDLAVMEYNFGGPNALYAGLATADALGRMAAAGVRYSGYWGHLQGWLAEAFRLYTAPYEGASGFAGQMVEAHIDDQSIASVHAAYDGTHFHVILINKSDREIEFEFSPTAQIDLISGFDIATPKCQPIDVTQPRNLSTPDRSARIVRMTM